MRGLFIAAGAVQVQANPLRRGRPQGKVRSLLVQLHPQRCIAVVILLKLSRIKPGLQLRGIPLPFHAHSSTVCLINRAITIFALRFGNPSSRSAVICRKNAVRASNAQADRRCHSQILSIPDSGPKCNHKPLMIHSKITLPQQRTSIHLPIPDRKRYAPPP